MKLEYEVVGTQRTSDPKFLNVGLTPVKDNEPANHDPDRNPGMMTIQSDFWVRWDKSTAPAAGDTVEMVLKVKPAATEA